MPRLRCSQPPDRPQRLDRVPRPRRSYGKTTLSLSSHIQKLTPLSQCGSFGFELKPSDLTPEEAAAIPGILAAWKEINPIVITGSFYRLRLPDDSNWPAVQFVSKEEDKSFVLAFQQHASIKPAPPPLKMQGLDGDARYSSNVFNGTYSGKTLMNSGLNLDFETGDHQSLLIWLYKE